MRNNGMRWCVKLSMFIALFMQYALLLYGINSALFYAWRTAFVVEDPVFLNIWFYLWVDICIFTVLCSILLINTIIKHISSAWEVLVARFYFAAVLLVIMDFMYILLLNMRDEYVYANTLNMSFYVLSIALCVALIVIGSVAIRMLVKNYHLPGHGYISLRERRMALAQIGVSILCAFMIVAQSLRAIDHVYSITLINASVKENMDYHYCVAMILAVTFTFILLLLWYSFYKVVVLSSPLQ